MAAIEPIVQEASYAAGDPWTPGDANLVPIFSQGFCDVALINHKDDGVHAYDTNVAQVYALVTWTGAAYTITAGKGIATGAGSITRNSAGNVTLTMDVEFAASDSFGVDVGVGPLDECVVGYQDLTGTTSSTKCTIQLVDNTGAAADKSFGVAIYGVRNG